MMVRKELDVSSWQGLQLGVGFSLFSEVPEGVPEIIKAAPFPEKLVTKFTADLPIFSFHLNTEQISHYNSLLKDNMYWMGNYDLNEYYFLSNFWNDGIYFLYFINYIDIMDSRNHSNDEMIPDDNPVSILNPVNDEVENEDSIFFIILCINLLDLSFQPITIQEVRIRMIIAIEIEDTKNR